MHRRPAVLIRHDHDEAFGSIYIGLELVVGRVYTGTAREQQ